MHPTEPNPDLQHHDSPADTALEVTYTADDRTASRLSRAAALARWRSPASLALLAAIPLILMARRIVDLIVNTSQSGAGILGIVGIYFVLLAAAIVFGVFITGMQMILRNPHIAAYAAAGTPLSVRYHDDALELTLATGVTRISYSELKEVFPIAGAVWLRGRGMNGIVVPRELVPDAASDYMGRRSFAADMAKPIGVGLACVVLATGVLIAASVRGSSDDATTAPVSTSATTTTYATTTAPNPGSFDNDFSDRTPFTSQALLPQKFTDEKGVNYTLRSSGTHSCDALAHSSNVTSALTHNRCANALTGSFVDWTDKILVSVTVVAFPTATDAEAARAALDGQPQNWTIWCPRTGAGSSVCDTGKGDATTSGWSLRDHRYLLHATAIYISLADDDGANEWLQPAGRAAVMSAGPNNWHP